MKYIILNWLLLAIGAQTPLVPWKFLKVDTHLKIQLPIAAQEMDIPSTMAAADAPNQHDPQVQASRAFRGEDPAAVYILVVVPFSGVTHMPTDAAARLDYYKSRLVPMLVARAHGELLTQSVSIKKGVEILTIKFQALSRGGVPVVKYMRVFSVGQMIYELFFIPKDGTGQNCADQRNRYFETLIITP